MWSVDPRAARVLIDRAIELLPPTDPERLELECGLAEVYKALSENTMAVSVLEAVVERARTIGDARIELRSQVELVWPRLLDGVMTVPEASTFLDDALSRLDQAGDRYGVARAEETYGLLLGSFGNRHDAALAHYERAIQAYVDVGLPAERNSLKVAVCVIGGSIPVPEVLDLCATAIVRRGAHPQEHAYLQAWVAWPLALNDDLDGARHAADEARRALSEFGEDAALQTTCAVILGSIELLAEDWLAAETIFQDALDFCTRRSFSPAWLAQFLSLLGEVALGKSDLVAALEYAEEANRLSPESDVHVAVQWRRVAARALAGDGHAERVMSGGGRSRRDRRHKRRPRRPRRHQSRSRRGAGFEAASGNWPTRLREALPLTKEAKVPASRQRLATLLGGHVPAGIRAGSPAAGAIVWNIAALMTIVATIATTVRNFVNAASISVSPPSALHAARLEGGPNRLDHGFQTAR